MVFHWHKKRREDHTWHGLSRKFSTLLCYCDFKMSKLFCKELRPSMWTGIERNIFWSMNPRPLLRWLQIVRIGSLLKTVCSRWVMFCMLERSWEGQHIRDRWQERFSLMVWVFCQKIFEKSRGTKTLYCRGRQCSTFRCRYLSLCTAELHWRHDVGILGLEHNSARRGIQTIGALYETKSLFSTALG